MSRPFTVGIVILAPWTFQDSCVYCRRPPVPASDLAVPGGSGDGREEREAPNSATCSIAAGAAPGLPSASSTIGRSVHEFPLRKRPDSTTGPPGFSPLNKSPNQYLCYTSTNIHSKISVLMECVADAQGTVSIPRPVGRGAGRVFPEAVGPLSARRARKGGGSVPARRPAAGATGRGARPRAFALPRAPRAYVKFLHGRDPSETLAITVFIECNE